MTAKEAAAWKLPNAFGAELGRAGDEPMAEDWIEQRHRLATVASEATARADRYAHELRMARLIIA